jgi:hypothetical protein
MGRVTDRIDTKTKVLLPETPKNTSNIKVSDSGVDAKISASYAPPVPDITAEKTAESGMILAGLFATAAVVFLALRFTIFPIIPLIAPIACGAASAIFFMLPTVVDRHSGKIILGLLAALAWSVYEGWHQDKLHKKDPPKKKEPESGTDPTSQST